MKKQFIVIFICVIFAVAIGCSSDVDTSEEPSVQDESELNEVPEPNIPDPITLTISGSSNEEMLDILDDALATMFPHITLERVEMSGNALEDYRDLLASGQRPDLMMVGQGGVRYLEDFEMNTDHGELIEQRNFDTERVKEGLLDYVRNFLQDPTTLSGMPLRLESEALYYNKDIFDRFAVAYPRDGVTWNEIIDLAGQVTREDDGVQYSGLNGPANWTIKSQLDQFYIDPETGRASINTDEWREAIGTLARLHQAQSPGIESENNDFFEYQNQAMTLGGRGFISRLAETDINWDMTTFPVFDSRPGYSPSLNGVIIAVTSMSEKKQEAFQVIEAYYSDETQEKLSADGHPTIVKGYEEIFMSNHPFVEKLEGKNLQAIDNIGTPGVPHAPSEFNGDGSRLMIEAVERLKEGDTDINTIFREAEDELNQIIDGGEAAH